MSDDRKRKPSVWRIAIVCTIALVVGYFIYAIKG